MSDESRPSTRGQEHEIAIDAPVEAVWRAISEAAEVTRWFVSEAEIEPKVGGTYRVSWGEGMEGVSDITAFEPGRRLRIVHRPMPGSPEMPTGPIAEEFEIRTEEGKTVLRLVTSGIPGTEDWDDFYEGTRRGWRIFLMGLRHYLEYHAGTPRDHILSSIGLPGSCEEAWTALLGPEGIGLEEPGGLAAGDAYSGRTAFGDAIDGRVLLHDPPYRLLVTVDGLDNALLGATLEPMGPTNFLYLSLSTFGLRPEAVTRLREEWGRMARALFPGDADPGEAFEAMMSGDAESASVEG